MSDIKKLMLHGDWEHFELHWRLMSGLNRKQVLKKYLQKFKTGIDQETDKNKKVNSGRKAANLWLLNAATKGTE